MLIVYFCGLIYEGKMSDRKVMKWTRITRVHEARDRYGDKHVFKSVRNYHANKVPQRDALESVEINNEVIRAGNLKKKIADKVLLKSIQHSLKHQLGNVISEESYTTPYIQFVI